MLNCLLKCLVCLVCNALYFWASVFWHQKLEKRSRKNFIKHHCPRVIFFKNLFIFLFHTILKGRKSRRERRIAKERRLKDRGDLSPLSYVVREQKESRSESNESSSRSSSRSRRSKKRSNRSRSRSRSRSGSKTSKESKVLFITSFGADINTEAANNADKYREELISSTLKKDLGLNLKLLKNSSRSRSNSPPAVSFKKSASRTNRSSDSSSRSVSDQDNSNSSDSSDEEKAYKNYLKRRQSRMQSTTGSDHPKSKSIESGSKSESHSAASTTTTSNFNKGNASASYKVSKNLST